MKLSPTYQYKHQKQLKGELELKEVQEVAEEDKKEHQEEEEVEEVVNIEVEEELQEEVQMAIKLTNQDQIDQEPPLWQMLKETKLLNNQEKKDSHTEVKMEIIHLKDNLELEEVLSHK